MPPHTAHPNPTSAERKTRTLDTCASLLPLFPLHFHSKQKTEASLARTDRSDVRRCNHLRIHPGAPPGVRLRLLARRRRLRPPRPRSRETAAREEGAEEPVPRDQAAAVGEVGGGDPRPGEGGARLARHLPDGRGRRAGLRPRRAPHQGRQGQGQLPQRLRRRPRARRRGGGGEGRAPRRARAHAGRAPAAQDGGGVRGRNLLLRRGEGAVRGAARVRELHELPRHPLHGGRGRPRRRRRRSRGARRALDLRRLRPAGASALVMSK